MKTIGTEIKWGLIFILTSLLWMLFEKSVGWHDERLADHATYTNLFAILAIGIYVLALYDKRKNYYQGVMSWKEGFVSGLLITLVVSVFSPLTQYIVHSVISPDYFNNMITYSVENAFMTQDQAESYFSLNNYLLQATIGALVMGIITSALVALIMKKKTKLPKEQVD